MEIAPNGHAAAQLPQPAQAASVTIAGYFFSLSKVIAWYGQTCSQIPHERQSSGFTMEVIASTVIVPFRIRRFALAAAALAWLTESFTSLGPSAQPAKKTPLVGAYCT